MAREGRRGAMTHRAAPQHGDLLRDLDAEAAYLAAVIRDPGWLEQYSIPSDWLTTYEPGAAYEAVLRLVERKMPVTVEAVAVEAGLPLAVLHDFPWDADVPAHARRLRELHERRVLALIGETAVAYATDPDRDPRESALRLIAVLGEVTR